MDEEKNQSSQFDDSDFELKIERDPIEEELIEEELIEEEPIGYEPVGREPQIEIPSEPPKKSGAGFVIKIIVGVVVLGVAGFGVCLATRIWDPLWSPFRPSPEKVIEEMTTNMKEVKILHSNVGIDITASEKGAGEFKVFIGFEGDSDTTNSENLKAALDFNIGLIVQTEAYSENKEVNFSLTGRSKTIGEISYLRLNTITIPADLEPFLAMFGINLDEIKGQWIKIDKEALEELGGEAYSSQEMSKEEQENLVKRLKEVFAKRKIYYVKKEMPDEKINGKKVYHYLVVLDKEGFKKAISETFRYILETKTFKESIEDFGPGESFGYAALIGAWEGMMDEFLGKIGEITFDFWIGKKDYHLYKIKGEKEIDLSKFDEKVKEMVDIKVDLDFSNFNQPVEIEPPENFKSLEEILSSAGGFIQGLQQAKDVVIKADLMQMQAMAEIIYSDKFSYINVNCQNEEIKPLCEDIKENAGMELVVHRSDQKYCAYIELSTIKSIGKTNYCIDSSGSALEVFYTNPGLKGYCDGKTFVCPPMLPL